LRIGNVLTLASLIFQREFAPSSFGRLLGSSIAIGQVAYAVIPTILGAVRDVAGSARAVLGVCIGLQLLAAMLMALSSLSKRPSLRKVGRNGGGH